MVASMKPYREPAPAPDFRLKLDAPMMVPVSPVVSVSSVPAIVVSDVEYVLVVPTLSSCVAGMTTPPPASSARAMPSSVALSVSSVPPVIACRSIIVWSPADSGSDNPDTSTIPRSLKPLRCLMTLVPTVVPSIWISHAPVSPDPAWGCAFRAADAKMRPGASRVMVGLSPATVTRKLDVVSTPGSPIVATPELKAAPHSVASGSTTMFPFLVMMVLYLLLDAWRSLTMWLPLPRDSNMLIAPPIARSLAPGRYRWSCWLEVVLSMRRSHLP